MEDIAKRLKALADTTRLRILFLISRTDECCVCEIQEVLKLTAPTASRNLRILEEADFVTKRRQGKWMYFRLDDMPDFWNQHRKLLLEMIADSPDASDLLSDIETWCRQSTCGISQSTGVEQV